MTMPSKIWAIDYERGQTWLQDVEGWDIEQPHAKYIRADIAEELARALEGVMHYIRGHAGSDEQDAVDEALSRFRAITH